MDIVDDEGKLGREQEALNQLSMMTSFLCMRLQNQPKCHMDDSRSLRGSLRSWQPYPESVIAQTQSCILAVGGEVSALTVDPIVSFI